MSYRPSLIGSLFLLLGLALAGCEVLGVYEYVSEQRSGLYVAAASCIIAAVTPALPALADFFGRGKQAAYCAMSWLGFLVCLAIVLTAAIQRTGTATDNAERSRIAAERKEKIAQEAERQAKTDYTEAQAAALKECADGRGKKCLEAEQKAEVARKALALARADLIFAPAGEQTDALARRLSAMLPVSEERIRLLQPLQVPLALSLLSVLFFAAWSRIDFGVGAQHEPAQAALAAPPPTPAPDLKPAPALKIGKVAAFLVSCTEPAEGEAVEIEGDLYKSYTEWCSGNSASPMGKMQFARELAEVGKQAGLLIEIRGRQAFCLDTRLAA